jgi:hypothetical protein
LFTQIPFINENQQQTGKAHLAAKQTHIIGSRRARKVRMNGFEEFNEALEKAGKFLPSRTCSKCIKEMFIHLTHAVYMITTDLPVFITWK